MKKTKSLRKNRKSSSIKSIQPPLSASDTPDSAALNPPVSVPKQRIEVSSLYKGVQVWVNQKKVGRIFEIERKKGLLLPTGKKHQIHFKSPACETKTKLLFFEKRVNKIPRIIFDCIFKPAAFEIKSSLRGEIYLDSKGGKPIRLGHTNQEIKYQMNTSRLQLSFMVVFKSGKIDRLNGILNAGKKSSFSL